MHVRHLLGIRLYPFIFASIALEIGWFVVIERRNYPWREMLTSFSIHAMHLPVRLLAPLLLAPIAWFLWDHRLMTVPVNTAWGLVLLFLAEEFVYYWAHRASHKVRWMWASHVVHHTPETIHLAGAFRIGVTDILSGNWLFRLPLYLLGFNPLAVAAMGAINLFYQFWLHTDLIGRLGPVEWVFNTPSHHRVHHASNGEYLDRNYGGILIIWDRLFGTFAREQPGRAIAYGLVQPIGSLNPIKIAFHEWGAIARDVRRAGSARENLRMLFGRPGMTSVP